MHRKRQAPSDLPPHISDHLLMHRLQLRCPVFPTKGLEHSWEIVRTMKGSIVINVLDQNFIFTSLSNGRKIINKSRIWLHIFKRKNEWSKVLESCHLDPFARVLAELIKEGDKLLLFCLFCCYCWDLRQYLDACFSYGPDCISTELPIYGNNNTNKYLLTHYFSHSYQSQHQLSPDLENRIIRERHHFVQQLISAYFFP